MLHAVGRAIWHCMRAVTMVMMCERVLRCWFKILIFSGISDIYLQLIFKQLLFFDYATPTVTVRQQLYWSVAFYEYE